jgi:NAD(P)-dependent dehydrogenase (short-subunit alcohol dehydrogenase family)
MTSRHDLVIGGSGMLAGLCLRLAREGGKVSVIARNLQRIEAIAGQAPGSIFPAPVDYRDRSAFDRVLCQVAADHGRPGRVFCWVHEDIAADASLQAADHAEGSFWHILGSAAANPAEPLVLSRWRERFERPGLDYRQIVLGFVSEGSTSRWLTDAEISDGVYNAAQADDVLSIVGIVAPWSRRP